MCVGRHVCMYVCTYVPMLIDIGTCIQCHTYVRIHTHWYVCVYFGTYWHMSMLIDTCECNTVCTYVHTHVGTYCHMQCDPQNKMKKGTFMYVCVEDF